MDVDLTSVVVGVVVVQFTTELNSDCIEFFEFDTPGVETICKVGDLFNGHCLVAPPLGFYYLFGNVKECIGGQKSVFTCREN